MLVTKDPSCSSLQCAALFTTRATGTRTSQYMYSHRPQTVNEGEGGTSGRRRRVNSNFDGFSVQTNQFRSGLNFDANPGKDPYVTLTKMYYTTLQRL